MKASWVRSSASAGSEVINKQREYTRFLCCSKRAAKASPSPALARATSWSWVSAGILAKATGLEIAGAIWAIEAEYVATVKLLSNSVSAHLEKISEGGGQSENRNL